MSRKKKTKNKGILPQVKLGSHVFEYKDFNLDILTKAFGEYFKLKLKNEK